MGLNQERNGRSRDGEGIVLVSNRGPIEHYLDDDGNVAQRETGGGLATALSAFAESEHITWIAGAVTPTDRKLISAGAGKVALSDGYHLRLVSAPEQAYDYFYSTFSNPILWFLQHSIWHHLQRPNLREEAVHSWENGYLPVNQAFAEAVVEELTRRGCGTRVMLHDYHLYAAPLFIRDRCPNATLQLFLHIPWPGPEAWQELPMHIVQSICEGLLANDSIVFQTRASQQNFLLTCLAFLPGVLVDFGASIVSYRGRRIRLAANAISVDIFGLRRQIASPETYRYLRKLECGGIKRIVRVDRLDPSKNIVAGFHAYRTLLEQHPEWLGRATFQAFLVPSRSSIPEYAAYAAEVFATADAINSRFGHAGWKPISIYYEQNRMQALAGLSQYDVLLANSLADGMNLVAKEGPIVNQRDGALVLSVTAGAFQELWEGALPVWPEDTAGTAEALHQALTMSDFERRERARFLRHAVSRHDIHSWLDNQINEFEEMRPPQRSLAAALT